MLPEETIVNFVSMVQNLRTAQQRFFMQRTSGNLNTAKKWEKLVDHQLTLLWQDLNKLPEKDATQEKLF